MIECISWASKHLLSAWTGREIILLRLPYLTPTLEDTTNTPQFEDGYTTGDHSNIMIQSHPEHCMFTSRIWRKFPKIKSRPEANNTPCELSRLKFYTDVLGVL